MVPGLAEVAARARRAQSSWATTPVRERAGLLERVREVLYTRRDDVADSIVRETSKPRAEALVAEVVTSLEMLRFFARTAPGLLAPRRQRSGTLALWRKRFTVESVPVGVVGVISPWNYPFMLPAGHVAAALVAGNAVLLKPSELTPETGALLGELFREAGLPDGLLHIVQGSGAAGAAVVSVSDKVSFTGSVATGRAVAHQCAERLVPCILELGGSDPALVLADANVELAAQGITWGRFTNAGQTCVATKRVFVVDAVYDRFVRALEARVGALRMFTPGADTEYEIGPLVHPGGISALTRVRDDAWSRGAHSPATPSAPPACFAPTILLDVPPDAQVLREETFGPLLPVVRVADDDAAVEAANESPFGLSASVWSRSRSHARRVARRLRAGTVAINDVALVAGLAEVPHGGTGWSGYGRAHGIEGLLAYVRPFGIVDDVLPNVRQPWWFPYSRHYRDALGGYASLTHAPGWGERISGISRTIQLLRRSFERRD